MSIPEGISADKFHQLRRDIRKSIFEDVAPLLTEGVPITLDEARTYFDNHPKNSRLGVVHRVNPDELLYETLALSRNGDLRITNSVLALPLARLAIADLNHRLATLTYGAEEALRKTMLLKIEIAQFVLLELGGRDLLR